MERSKLRSGDSLRVMIRFAFSSVTDVAKAGSSSRLFQPSSTASRLSRSKRPEGLVKVPRPRRRSWAMPVPPATSSERAVRSPKMRAAAASIPVPFISSGSGSGRVEGAGRGMAGG